MMVLLYRAQRWSRSPSTRFADWLAMALLTTRAAATLTQQYCSNQNTGGNSDAVSNQFNSNGKCQTQCSGYAFAVVQASNCWCSNYAPGDTTSVQSCGVACPGYPFENCGDQSQGLFGYVALGPAPSGTQGAASPSSSPSPSQVAVSSQQPTPSIVPTTPSTTTSSSSSSTSTSTSTTTTSSSTSSWTPTPWTSVMTVTGQVITSTITPTAPPTSTQTIVTAADATGGFFSSPGKVAGTFVAIAVVIVLIIIGLILFFMRRRRRLEQDGDPSVAGSGTPQRRPSRMSQMGLLGSGSQRDEKSFPSLQTSGWGPESGGSEKSPADTLGRRGSFPPMVDQRLEPTAVWNPIHDNGSHVSIRSFRDDRDYSRRMLRVVNSDGT